MFENMKQFEFLRILKISNYFDADAIDQILWTVLRQCPFLRDLVQFGDQLQIISNKMVFVLENILEQDFAFEQDGIRIGKYSGIGPGKFVQ